MFTANKIFNGKQCIIEWYVNDNKVTHVIEDMITGVIYITKKHFVELAYFYWHGDKAS